MTHDELVRRCLAFPATSEDFPFGDEASVLKVAGKVFALVLLSADPPAINLKCDPVLAVELRLQHAAVAPGYHMNKTHWNTVTIDGSVPDDLVDEMIEHSYDLVVAGLSRRVRLEHGLGT